jgi:hypothetical protein
MLNILSARINAHPARIGLCPSYWKLVEGTAWRNERWVWRQHSEGKSTIELTAAAYLKKMIDFFASNIDCIPKISYVHLTSR